MYINLKRRPFLYFYCRFFPSIVAFAFSESLAPPSPSSWGPYTVVLLRFFQRLYYFFFLYFYAIRFCVGVRVLLIHVAVRFGDFIFMLIRRINLKLLFFFIHHFAIADPYIFPSTFREISYFCYRAPFGKRYRWILNRYIVVIWTLNLGLPIHSSATTPQVLSRMLQ